MARVVAAADINERRKSVLSDCPGVSHYLDHREMLAKEGLDLVCILSPAETHRKIALDCLELAVPVLCEKPLASRLCDAIEIHRQYRRMNGWLAYGASYRFLPAIVAARKAIADGQIGVPRLIRETLVVGAGPAEQMGLGPAHYRDGGMGGSGLGLVDHGIHLIDLLPWLIDSPISSVWGKGNISGQTLRPEYAVIEFANACTAHLLYDDGTWSTALPGETTFSRGASWGPGGLMPPGQLDPDPGSIHVHGTKGSLRIHHYAHEVYLRNADGVRRLEIEGEPAPAQFRYQLEACLKALSANQNPVPSLEDGVSAVRWLEAIYDSQCNNLTPQAEGASA